MKLTHLVTATAAVALLGGAAYAQTKNDVPKAPTPGSVTGDWNGAHAPSDDKQYQEKVTVPVGTTAAAEAPPADASTTASDPNAAVNPPAAAPAPASTDAAVASDASTTTPAASFTSMTVTNGPVPDTAENRSKYGDPMSRAGKRTAARGN
jgi:hypothetical protein